jgi:hypothetical protein
VADRSEAPPGPVFRASFQHRVLLALSLSVAGIGVRALTENQEVIIKLDDSFMGWEFADFAICRPNGLAKVRCSGCNDLDARSGRPFDATSSARVRMLSKTWASTGRALVPAFHGCLIQYQPQKEKPQSRWPAPVE